MRTEKGKLPSDPPLTFVLTTIQQRYFYTHAGRSPRASIALSNDDYSEAGTILCTIFIIRLLTEL